MFIPLSHNFKTFFWVGVSPYVFLCFQTGVESNPTYLYLLSVRYYVSKREKEKRQP
ncbi:hypothetical protein RT761_02448 [Atribacter laminatus]|uniref:Uncharacterized protein n=1 Tax=Atribacter laminatus TaxID=2847778 RepID=A0A7T1ANL4_ATRLM|nr:hypothetical protein RT761_02448 [Atribacter laminatus]